MLSVRDLVQGSRIWASALSLLLLTGLAHSGTDHVLWVKAEGRLNEKGAIIVKRLRQREPDKTYILEGLVERRLSDGKNYLLAGIEIVPSDRTAFSFISGAEASDDEVAKGVRIKAVGHFRGKQFHANEIRVFQHSKDRDVEVEGPIKLAAALKDGRKVYHIGPIALLLHKSLLSPNSAVGRLLTEKAGASLLRGLSDRVTVDGKVKMVDNTRVVDLPEEELAGSSRRYAKLQTTVQTEFSKHVSGYGRTELLWRDLQAPDLTSSSSQQVDFRVRDLYLALDDIAGIQGLGFKIGRQRFRDTRTWLMDSRLDALRLTYNRNRFGFAFSVSRKLGQAVKNRDQLRYIGMTSFRFGRGLKSSLFLIKEVDQRQGRDNPLWLAMQLRGKLSSHLEWWGQGARYSSRKGQVALRGYGVDTGLILRFLTRTKGPFLSYHFAYGSADDKQTTDVRERFRQPTLQLNYYTYGSRKRIYYYGSLLTPELSNLRYQALGLGYVFSPKASLQGIWRSYRQLNASKTIRSNSLGIRPEGTDTALGNSAELLFDTRPWDTIEFSISAEWFIPGAAFAPGTANLFGLHSEFIIYF